MKHFERAESYSRQRDKDKVTVNLFILQVVESLDMGLV